MTERKRASDYPPEVLELFDGYVHNAIDRREFLSRAAKYAVGGMTALAMLESLQPKFAWAEQVAKDDKRIKAEYATYVSAKGSGEMKGYLARPADVKGKVPGVVVIHENRGLNPYIEDVARRLATEGYLAFAPDALTPLGGYPGDEDKARELFQKLDAAKRTEDLLAAAEWVKDRKDVGKVGCVGFCFGGGTCNMFASKLPWLAAVVPFYGPGLQDEEEVKAIKAPLLIHFAQTDERVNAGWPAYRALLDKHNVRYAAGVYAGTQHGFHNDTTPRYHESAAKFAWERTLSFFAQHLR